MRRQYSDWAFPPPGRRHSGCTFFNEDAPGDPPDPYPKDPGRKRLTFRYSGLPERPRVIKVSMWRSVAADGSPQGRSQRLRTRRLRRVGHKRWTFRVRADLSAERFFFVYARWPRNDGCGPRQVGDTLRTRPR